MNNKPKEQVITLRIECDFKEGCSMFLDERIKEYKELHLLVYDNTQTQRNYNLYEAYSISRIMKIIEESNRNQHLLPILGINAERASQNYMHLTHMITPATITSLRKLISQARASQIISPQLMQVLLCFNERVHQICMNYKEQITWLEQESYDFYLVQRNQNYEIVLGFADLRLSTDPMSDDLQLTKELRALLRDQSTSSQSLSSIKYPNSFINNLKQGTSVKHLQKSKGSYFLNSFFSKYAQTICNFLTESINNGLTRYLFQRKIVTNGLTVANLSMKDRLTNRAYQGDIYHNVTCDHFQGITLKTFQQSTECPLCGNKLVFEKGKLQSYCQNVFQMILSCNFLNPNHEDVTYYFLNNVFTLKVKEQTHYKQRFSSFYHYRSYVERCKDLPRRPEISPINRYETIPFFHKLMKQPKFYEPEQFIECPVRGKFCRHWQFYDLRRVYDALLVSQDDYFECFVCCRDIQFEEIVYLKEMQEIITLTFDFIHELAEKKRLNAALKINHESQKVHLALKSQDSEQIQLELRVYPTLNRPSIKSRLDLQSFEEIEFTPSRSFIKLFYGC